VTAVPAEGVILSTDPSEGSVDSRLLNERFGKLEADLTRWIMYASKWIVFLADAMALSHAG